MARELITSWGDYQLAIDRLLATPCRIIRIYDEDLAQLHLESSTRLPQLKSLLSAGTTSPCLQIALRNSEPLRNRHPLLMNLLAQYGHRLAAQQTAPQLANLRDAMILLDDQHGLIRFDRDQARSKLLIDEPEELRPYRARFKEIWEEGGEMVSATTLGL
jgi:hypothetical protein